jgi:predicted dehydrogenase
MSGIGLKERRFKDQKIEVEMDDNTHLLLDFGDSAFCLLFASNSYDGPGHAFSVPFISGSDGGVTIGSEGLEVWGRNVEEWRRVENPSSSMPFVSGPHLGLPERHVYSDIMHMVDCVLNGKEPVVSAEHARHVIEIIALGYKAAETGQTQDETTTFSFGELAVDL